MTVANMTVATSARFNAHEFYLLLSQFAPVAAVGWENPYTGWLAEEIEVAQKEAYESLLSRDVIRMVDGDEIAIEQSLVSLLTACAQPEFSLVLTAAQAGNTPFQFLVHAKDDAFVKHAIQGEEHTLEAIAEEQLAAQHLLPHLLFVPASGKSAGPFRLSEDTLLASEALVRDGQLDEAEKNLKQEITGEQQGDILAAFTKPLSRSAVILIARTASGAPAEAGVAVYQGEAQTWLMRPSEQAGARVIEFIPATEASVAAELSKMLMVAKA
ncbi:MAG: ESX secretion-associated protein EspG [Anaerolineales bacterium]|nr:ESX secretion-associated protein EspG [Anaerolineales bacterium]